MIAVVMLLALASGAMVSHVRRKRRAVRIDRYHALGPLPDTWRPASRTVVRTHHLAPWVEHKSRGDR